MAILAPAHADPTGSPQDGAVERERFSRFVQSGRRARGAHELLSEGAGDAEVSVLADPENDINRLNFPFKQIWQEC